LTQKLIGDLIKVSGVFPTKTNFKEIQMNKVTGLLAAVSLFTMFASVNVQADNHKAKGEKAGAKVACNEKDCAHKDCKAKEGKECDCKECAGKHEEKKH
jgi:hypothetical protein